MANPNPSPSTRFGPGNQAARARRTPWTFRQALREELSKADPECPEKTRYQAWVGQMIADFSWTAMHESFNNGNNDGWLPAQAQTSRANSTMSGGNDLIAKPFLFMELAVKALVYIMRGRVAAAR